MKNFALLLCVICFITLFGCMDKGYYEQRLDGTETTLPDYLKGMKADAVGINGLNYIYVATFPDKETVSLTYSQGKTKESVVIVLPDSNCNQRTIYAKEIMMENDSMILIRK